MKLVAIFVTLMVAIILMVDSSFAQGKPPDSIPRPGGTFANAFRRSEAHFGENNKLQHGGPGGGGHSGPAGSGRHGPPPPGGPPEGGSGDAGEGSSGGSQ